MYISKVGKIKREGMSKKREKDRNIESGRSQ